MRGDTICVTSRECKRKYHTVGVTFQKAREDEAEYRR